MKRLLISMPVIILILSMAACGKTTPGETGTPGNTSIPTQTITPTQTTTPAISDSDEKTEDSDKGNQSVEGIDSSDSNQNANDNTSEETSMRLFVNDIEIPVIWEDNASVAEIMEEAAKGDIVVSMSMYGDFEQVGSLGRRYTSSDKQITTHNGDIVLYSSSNIVMFYGSNSWSYTRLGKMDLSGKEVTDLLSKGDVTVTLKR